MTKHVCKNKPQLPVWESSDRRVEVEVWQYLFAMAQTTGIWGVDPVLRRLSVLGVTDE